MALFLVTEDCCHFICVCIQTKHPITDVALKCKTQRQFTKCDFRANVYNPNIHILVDGEVYNTHKHTKNYQKPHHEYNSHFGFRFGIFFTSLTRHQYTAVSCPPTCSVSLHGVPDVAVKVIVASQQQTAGA